MQTGPLRMEAQDPTTFAGGPCPSCPGKGALLILRREPDARLLFHCSHCGLAFTHIGADEEPEYAKSLQGIAPGGTRPATEEEVRAAGLWPHASRWTGLVSAPEPPKADPARAFLKKVPVPPSRPVPVLHSSGSSGGGAQAVGAGAAILVIIKILMLLGHAFRH